MGQRTNELEKKANKQNILYRKDKKALIMKLEVPIILTREGLVAKQSTIDYYGVINGGKAIAFDAKETKNKTSFPLSNIKDHQLAYLNFHKDLGGYSFFMIHFKSLYDDEVFITPLDIVNQYMYKEKRKSIPINEFKEEWLVNIENYLDKVIEMEADLT